MTKELDNIRRQLTLFVQYKDSLSIEKIREEYNPLQSVLIKCHVTLCREDEITNLEVIIENLNHLKQRSFFIEFHNPTRFENGLGVLLPAKAKNIEFLELRRVILKGIIDNPRLLDPHITLMHPRNSICTNEIFAEIENANLPKRLNFNKISLIEQINGRQWNILQEFELM